MTRKVTSAHGQVANRQQNKKKYSFKEAAFLVLKEENKTLSASEITKIAWRRKLINSGGQTPHATMYSELLRDIKKHGEKSRFVLVAPNTFGLKTFKLDADAQRIRAEKEKREKDDESQLSTSELRGRDLVGSLLGYDGVVYSPTSESALVFLFGKVHNKLQRPIKIETIRETFPDAVGRRQASSGRGWEPVFLEFELQSSNFKRHKHPVSDQVIIVCWEDDWKKDRPEIIEVIELKSLIDDLIKRESYEH